jgi:hypothetical protein
MHIEAVSEVEVFGSKLKEELAHVTSANKAFYIRRILAIHTL